LSRIATGELKVAVGLQEPQSHYNLDDVETRAEASGDGYVLNGRKSVLIGGHAADLIIVSARTSGDARDNSGLSLFALDPEAAGIERRVYRTMDGAKGCDLFLNNVRVGADLRIGAEGAAGEVIQYQSGRAIAALCAEAIGAMEEAINLTLEYLKTRKQFRGAHRPFPGAAAPHGGHELGAGTGPLHDDPGGQCGRRRNQCRA